MPRAFLEYLAGLAAVAAFGAFVTVLAINAMLGCGQGGPCWLIGH